MKLVERFFAIVTTFVEVLSPGWMQDGTQNPLHLPSHIPAKLNIDIGPSFPAPGAPDKKPFTCKYPSMVGWEMCSTPEDRRCWLRRTADGKQYDVTTNYEKDMPIGITRNYNINLTDSWVAADGMNFPLAKLFNNSYPGPWIQACWGDRVIVNVTNNLQWNGTSIHWHGVVQDLTMHMDGVNGVTQCPIAPQDYFVYNFTAKQYGSSWYHSHYSVQYADGAVGPLTLHGPTSADWDEAISPPLIMTDWGHNSAFNAVHTGLDHKDILLNGRGNVTNFKKAYIGKNGTEIKPPYHIEFEAPKPGQRAKRYLMRIINTSFDSTFVFSIDNHWMQIVSSDFVPILPYMNTSVLVGIGQRYNVIVDADPTAYNDSHPLPEDGNYWIRTWVSPCRGPQGGDDGYERTGILRYDNTSIAFPSSEPWQNVSTTCADETYTSLYPIVPWTVEEPKNGYRGEKFDLWRNQSENGQADYFPLATWALSNDSSIFKPLRINYSDPTFLHLDHKGDWDPLLNMAVEDGTSEDWIYLVFQGRNGTGPGAHPIHLHGHDFALLEQAYNAKFDINHWTPKLINPPRRDVVLLPSSGYVVIAFRADNPGAWLVHCHIAFHISEGLGLQIMERQADAARIWPTDDSAIIEAERVCENWNTWYNDHKNWNVSDNCHPDKHDPKKDWTPAWCFQDDSGV